MNECSCSCFWYWAKITSIYMDSPGLLRINSTRHILRITMFLLAFFSFLNHSFIHSNKSSCLYHLRLLLGTKILTCITMSFLVFFFQLLNKHLFIPSKVCIYTYMSACSKVIIFFCRKSATVDKYCF